MTGRAIPEPLRRAIIGAMVFAAFADGIAFARAWHGPCDRTAERVTVSSVPMAERGERTDGAMRRETCTARGPHAWHACR